MKETSTRWYYNPQLIVELLAIAFATVMLPSLPDSEGASEKLEEEGYNPIGLGDKYHWPGWLNSRVTDFKAVSAKGDTVTGFVSRNAITGQSEIHIDNTHSHKGWTPN